MNALDNIFCGKFATTLSSWGESVVPGLVLATAPLALPTPPRPPSARPVVAGSFPHQGAAAIELGEGKGHRASGPAPEAEHPAIRCGGHGSSVT